MTADGKVDFTDFERFQECLAGPGVAITSPGCVAADLDADGDVDIRDLDAFVKSMSGRTRPDPAVQAGPSPAGHRVPPRPAGALTGSAFVAEALDATFERREARVREEIASGNIPDFLRQFVPVTVQVSVQGRIHTVTYEVAPDYLSVGSDADFVRMPMTPQTAQMLADRFSCVLPTRKMVDDIYAQAAVKLIPSPIDPKVVDMTQIATFYLHHLMIEDQRAGRPLGLLAAGMKKDVVVTPQLAARPAKVAIYGWHQLNGHAIQPLYLGHTNRWVDYSQCIRWVNTQVIVDGAARPIADVLRDPVLCVLLSDEGPVEKPRYPE